MTLADSPAAPSSTTPEATSPASSAEVYHKHGHCWWPQGEVDRLHQAAGAWSALATTIDRIAADGDRAIQSLKASSSGPTVDRIEAFWKKNYSDGSCAASSVEGGPVLTNLAATCRTLADACNDYAARVTNARHRVVELAGVAVSAVVVGGLLSVVTAGLSDAAAGGVLAEIAAAAAALEETIAGAVGTTLTRIGIDAAVGALAGVSSEALIIQPMEATVVPGGTYDWSAVVDGAKFGALTGPALGPAGRFTNKALGSVGGRIRSLLNHGPVEEVASPRIVPDVLPPASAPAVEPKAATPAEELPVSPPESPVPPVNPPESPAAGTGGGPAPAAGGPTPGHAYTSPGGLFYGVDDPSFPTRVDHVLAHTTDDVSRPMHGVFSDPSKALEIVDEAYLKAQAGDGIAVRQGSRTVYYVNMDRAVGYIGGTVGRQAGNPTVQVVQLVLEQGNHVVTAFPVAGMPVR
ncbi:hypothetical protein ND748_09320 [Frankia sp. AiPs1]|uniref:WXG100-like domain-containing protein n=1 Tax=Frankia sp. AiPs1 TaxID=573493 RepID=UPI00204320A5|nr:hypothetical protein [Frankia sp. AiPs1]MCM3921855.1 hypothetical protein [Frankia sp. AiPs1]